MKPSPRLASLTAPMKPPPRLASLAAADALQRLSTASGTKTVVTEDDTGVVVATVSSQMLLSLDVDFPVNKHGRPEEIASSILEAIDEREGGDTNCNACDSSCWKRETR
jgi:hypothetical protein